MAKKTLAFEIGTEELPAFDLHNATIQLEKLAKSAFDAAGIGYETISVHSTPRRLIVLATQVPEQTEAIEEVFKGPAVKIAFDDQGNPTKAALGFARGKGVDPANLERREDKGVAYVYATKLTPARRIADLLPDLLLGLITGLSWPRPQRWGTLSDQFRRPVRWLLALLGSEVIDVRFAGLVAGNTTPALLRFQMLMSCFPFLSVRMWLPPKKNARQSFAGKSKKLRRKRAWLPICLIKSWQKW